MLEIQMWLKNEGRWIKFKDYRKEANARVRLRELRDTTTFTWRLVKDGVVIDS